MNLRILLAHSISVMLVTGLLGCTSEKSKDIVQQDQGEILSIINLPNPKLLNQLLEFLGNQAIDAVHSTEALLYPTLEGFYAGTKHVPDNRISDMRDMVCDAQMDCKFFFDVGYAYKNGLAEEINNLEKSKQSMDLFWELDLDSIHNMLKTSIGIQPYTDDVFKIYKSNRCEAECKEFILTGMKVVLGLSTKVSQDSFERINLRSEEALGRIHIVRKAEKKHVNLEPNEPIEYLSAEPNIQSHVPVIKPHNYQQKIQQQTVVKVLKKPVPHVELVPNATGITENITMKAKVEIPKFNTYEEAISKNATAETKLNINKGTAPHLNIVDRKPQHKTSEVEYILIN